MSKLKLKRNVLLAPYTTFRIGGPAKYFLEVKSKEEIVQAIKWATENKISYFILGGGSNLLVSDHGFNGLVIKLSINNYQLLSKTEISVEAGVLLNQLVTKSIKNGLTGLEWAIGIPGTVGGAIRGNAGAGGHSISEVVKSVEVLVNHRLIQWWDNKDCQFDYRESIFKKKPNLIILSAKLKLKKNSQKEIQRKIKEYLEKRKNQPSEPSAGSIFKNPKLVDILKFQSNFNQKNRTPVINGQIPAGWLIEQCGLKGYRIGQAQISQKHANFIVNLGEAKAREVVSLINLIKKKVKDKFGIQLEEEIQYLGKGADFQNET